MAHSTASGSGTLVGFWKFKSNYIRTEDGTWFDDTILGGTFALSDKNRFCTFFRSVQGRWGYSGDYTFDGKVLKLMVDASMSEDIDGATLDRQIEFTNPNEFTYTGVEFHTGRAFKAVLIRA